MSCPYTYIHKYICTCKCGHEKKSIPFRILFFLQSSTAVATYNLLKSR